MSLGRRLTGPTGVLKIGAHIVEKLNTGVGVLAGADDFGDSHFGVVGSTARGVCFHINRPNLAPALTDQIVLDNRGAWRLSQG